MAIACGVASAARADDPWPAPAPVPVAPPPGEPPAGRLGEPPPAPAQPGKPDDAVPPPPEPPAAPAPPLESPLQRVSEFDVITLNNGGRFEGTIVEENDTKVVLQRVSESGGVSNITFPKGDISTLRRSGRAGQESPSAVVVRDAWFLLRSGGEPIGTRHVLLRSVRPGGQPGFRVEETTIQFPQGRRIPRTRIEVVEETDLRFLPRRITFRESIEPVESEDAPVRFERSVNGVVSNGVWRSTWRHGKEFGNTEVPLPPDTRGALGLFQWFLRDERAAGLVSVSVLDVRKDALVDAQVGYAALGGDGRPAEFHWVEGRERRITRLLGNEVEEETLADGLTLKPVPEREAKAIEQASRDQAKDPARREVTFADQGLTLTLPGPDWTAARPLASGFDAGWRMIARCVSAPLVADARVEWNPEGTPVGQSPAEAEAALLQRLQVVCRDLTVTEARKSVTALPGAWRMGVRGTLRETAVRTSILCVPRGAGQLVILAACPEAAWEVGAPALDRLLNSVRGL